MRPLNKAEIAIYDAGAIAMLAGLLLLMSPWRMWAVWVYGVGAAAFLIMQVRSQHHGDTITVRRLQRQQLLGALLLLVAAPMMWMNVNAVWPLRHNEWIAVVAIGAWMQAYAAFRLPREMDKEEKEKK